MWLIPVPASRGTLLPAPAYSLQIKMGVFPLVPHLPHAVFCSHQMLLRMRPFTYGERAFFIAVLLLCFLGIVMALVMD